MTEVAIDPDKHLRLLFWTVARFRRDDESVDELLGPAGVGYMHAIENHKPHLGRFSTYCVKCMRCQILSWRDERRWFVTLRRRRGKVYRRPYVSLFSELGDSYVLGKAPVFATVDNAGEQYLADAERNTLVNTMLLNLIATQRHAIHERFWKELGLKEIGDMLPIPIAKESVRQRIAVGLRECEEYLRLHARDFWEEYR